MLLHLRNKSSRNPLSINIPDTCIFHEQSPYDIVFSRKTYIRGLKTNETQKIRLVDVHKFFKESWISKQKTEQSLAIFAKREVLMLHDRDLFEVCCKTKLDPFFKKLRFLQTFS